LKFEIKLIVLLKSVSLQSNDSSDELGPNQAVNAAAKASCFQLYLV
jgi:hypothetical protein